MPRLSFFYGIAIYLYYEDHPRPHIHARYGGDEAKGDIATGEIIEGSLPGRASRLVAEWAGEDRDELPGCWEKATHGEEHGSFGCCTRPPTGSLTPRASGWVVWPVERVVRDNTRAWGRGELADDLLAFGDDGTGNPFCIHNGKRVVRWSWIDATVDRTSVISAPSWRSGPASASCEPAASSGRYESSR